MASNVCNFLHPLHFPMEESTMLCSLFVQFRIPYFVYKICTERRKKFGLQPAHDELKSTERSHIVAL